ncbi:MAG: signal peptidase II [Patescibacteria group bacterium]
MFKQRIFLAAGIAIALFLDLFTKRLAEKYFAEPFEIFPFLSFELSHNRALAFGIPFPLPLTILLSVSAVAILGWLFVKNLRKDSKIGLISLTLLLGGALGNLLERILTSQVTDFIALFFIPNFNLADTFLTFGVIILILGSKKIFKN